MSAGFAAAAVAPCGVAPGFAGGSAATGGGGAVAGGAAAGGGVGVEGCGTGLVDASLGGAVVASGLFDATSVEPDDPKPL